MKRVVIVVIQKESERKDMGSYLGRGASPYSPGSLGNRPAAVSPDTSVGVYYGALDIADKRSSTSTEPSASSGDVADVAVEAAIDTDVTPETTGPDRVALGVGVVGVNGANGTESLDVAASAPGEYASV